MTLFLRVLQAGDKAVWLREAMRNGGVKGFTVDPLAFRQVPGSPFAYWASDRVRQTFAKLSKFEAEGRTVRQGLATADDFRFLRAWWEVAQEQIGRRWVEIAKGGAYSPFYYDVMLVLDWFRHGSVLKAKAIAEHGNLGKRIYNEKYYFRPGLTWPRRTQKGLSLRAMPAGCIFADKGPAAFVADDQSEKLAALLAITNSTPFRALVELQMAFGSYEVGVIQRTPVPDLDNLHAERLAQLARRAWSLKRGIDTATQNSNAFILPALLQAIEGSLAACAEVWSERVRRANNELLGVQSEIDDLSFELYGIDSVDRAVMEADAAPRILRKPAEGVEANDTGAEDEEREEEADAHVMSLTAEVVSWAVGVAFGRFDVRLATSERQPPREPDPFDPRPPCSPGMLTGGDGLPLEAPPPGYPIAFPRDGIFADDPGDRADITGRVCAVFDCIFGAHADRFWTEAGQILGNGDGDLRPWLSSSLFDDTIRRYSKSRRQAPIYWQLATPSAGYSVWLYYHRLTKDTFYTVLSDHVGPKLQHEERRIGALFAEPGASPNAAQRRQVAAQEAFVEELRAFREEIARIAPLWNPNHDDGVIINFAPLWRLVPQHRAWQRECKACWDKLVEGDYDWSHLAMHLWPERVVPKCAQDRSLAIAHGLEDRLWAEDLVGRWRPRQSIDGTVRYLEEQLLSRALTQTLRELEAFSKEHGARHAGSGKIWWEALSAGDHDDHPLALALWPARVLSRARDMPELAAAHGIGGSDRRGSSRQHEPRHDQAKLAIVASFCDHVGTLSEWSQRWAALHTGGLDDEPIARFLYPRRVVERAKQDHDFAAKHDLARWFWLDEPRGLRRLMEPEQEQAAAVKERESAAIKAALKSLLEAPAANGGGRRRRKSASR
jgi:hypothetical protein